MVSTSYNSPLTYANFEEEIIWAVKQRQQSMKRINSDIILPNFRHHDPLIMTKFHKVSIIQTMATFVPNEVLMNIKDFTSKEFNCCLLLGKISVFSNVEGIMELMDFYDKGGKGGANQLTRMLDQYIGAIIEETMYFEGDILSLTPDSFLVFWKSTNEAMLKYYIHSAINCALVIQKKFGYFPVKEEIVLKGHYKSSSYVYLGHPVEELHLAEQKSAPGDVIVAPSAWKHVNVSEYAFVPMEDKEFNKILGISLTWQCAGKKPILQRGSVVELQELPKSSSEHLIEETETTSLMRTEGFSLRPTLLDSSRYTKEDLAKFVIEPLMNAIDAREPLKHLEEIRQVVIMHLNVSMDSVNSDNLEIVNYYYKTVCNKVLDHKGLVMKSSISQGIVTFIVVFGLRGLTTVRETQDALRCAVRCKHELDLFDEVHTVSISCTTGKCYCGVFGHPFRKEYAIFSKCLIKSSEMAVAYSDKVICDRTTFIHSNLNSENFNFLESKIGISYQGPIYEFTEDVDMITQTVSDWYPILGRDKEIDSFFNLFRVYIKNFGINPCCNYSKCSFKNCIIIDGVYRQGKSRLLREISRRVKEVDMHMLQFYENDYMSSYYGARLIMRPALKLGNYTAEYFRRKRIKEKMGEMGTSELLWVLNDVFDVNFPETKKNNIFEKEKTKMRKESIKILCTKCFQKPILILIDDADLMDEETWGLLLAMLETKRFFLIAAIDKTRRDLYSMEDVITSHHVLSIPLKSIPQIYLAGVVCQILKVYAIPADLEKLIQSNSKGNPGWIESFLLILQQSKKIVISRVDFKCIHEMALVAPPLYMLKRLPPNSVSYYKSLLEEKTLPSCNGIDPWEVYVDSCRDKFKNVDVRTGMQEIFCKETQVPVCLVTEEFDPQLDVDPNVTDDLNFLDVYDRLSFLEQQMLRCASVLGDPFTRRLLFFMCPPECEREGAEVLQNLFEKRIICCAKGDFNSGGDYILIRDKRVNTDDGYHVHCYCIGLDINDSCLFLPKYASCGFMRFRSADFARSAYHMIPDEDRKEIHSRAAKFIRKETRRCVSCGCGYFPAQQGCNMDSTAMGRVTMEEKEKKKSVHLGRMDFEELFDYSTHIAGRATITTKSIERGTRAFTPGQFRNTKSLTFSLNSDDRFVDLSYDAKHGKPLKYISPFTILKLRKRASLIRTFSKSDFLSCDCHLILNYMYKQLKYHYAGSEQWHNMIVSCIHYVRISMSNKNYASCMKTIKEALDVLENKGHILETQQWKVKMLIAKFYSLKGEVLLELDQPEEAYKIFLQALKIFGVPFPDKEKTLEFKLKLFNQKWRQKLGLYFLPGSFMGEENDISQLYTSNSISETLTNLCNIYMEKRQWKLAEMAAVLSLKNSLRTETNLIRICESFSNMMLVAQHFKKKFLWLSLEMHALRYCHRKRNFVEPPELKAISRLYCTICEARLARAEFDSALHVGYIAVSIATRCSEMYSTIKLLTLISMVLLDKLIVNDTTSILREIEFFADEIDYSSGRTWYYALAVQFHLETGYIISPFCSIESYYQGEGWKNDKFKEAKMRLIITMWVWYLRNNRWENASMLKKEVDMYRRQTIDTNNHAIDFLYILEGTLLTLVYKINKRSITGMIEGKIEVRRLIRKLHQVASSRLFIKAKFYLLKAYYSYILETRDTTQRLLRKCRKYCVAYEYKLVHFHSEHLEKAWFNTMSVATRDFWKNHCKSDNYISHHEMDLDNLKIYCFTYPKPLFRI
ncbi:adenylate cyclase type 10-like isoform X3 [Harmonia axyridis]|uniref:adenylate cyclase type 10-like isoform X3 n=1 Tax=Harmonia axyridis TaxID=115357 RepID=UPI001E278C9B|nr:adenylate cyclase type 10-like isoform X3 [Harmonia axyridis]